MHRSMEPVKMQKLDLPKKSNFRQNVVDHFFLILSGILFILITEICLGIYMYRFINRECLFKEEFQEYALEAFKSDAYKDEFKKIVAGIQGDFLLLREKREPVSTK